jgi:hypothetical protein
MKRSVGVFGGAVKHAAFRARCKSGEVRDERKEGCTVPNIGAGLDRVVAGSIGRGPPMSLGRLPRRRGNSASR